MKRKCLSIAMAFSLLTSLLSPAMAAVSVPGPETDLKGQIVILHTNDSHSRINDNMGFTAVSALKKACEASGATVLVLDAGDTLHGLPVANLSQGAYIVDIMNQVGYDAMTPGNHDFNYGFSRLLELSDTMDFPLLSANLMNDETHALALEPYTILKKGDISFGVFGLSTPETAYKTSPDNVKGLTFQDPIQAARDMVATLQEKEVDYIICLSHLGQDASSDVTSIDVANAVPGIDILIDGHSHTVLQDGLQINDTLIASTGEYIENIGMIVIDHAQNISAGLISAQQYSEKDAELDTFINGILEDLGTLLDVKVGTTTVDLDGERETNRTAETNLGNLTSDAFRWASGADIAFSNGGNIRASIPKGDITKRDLNTVFPFGNYIVTVEVTGEQLLSILENGVKGYPATSGGFPQVSGFSFRFDASREAGSRVYQVKIGDEPLDLNAKYLLATNDFLASGGDDYTMLAQCPIVNEFGALDDILVSYIESMDGVIGEAYAAPEGRIIQAPNPDWEQEEPFVNPFTDVNTDDWFYDAVVYVVQNALFEGTSATTFAPEMNMNRAMFINVLYRLAGEPDYTLEENFMPFVDLEEGEWYMDAILWAASTGIAKGYDNGAFGVNDPVSREQMCVFLDRFAPLQEMEPVVSEPGNFADKDLISTWALDAVVNCHEVGIIQGVGEQQTFDPTGSADRAAAAVVIMRCAQQLESLGAKA